MEPLTLIYEGELNSLKIFSISIAVVSDKCLNISSLSLICVSFIGGTNELKSDCVNSFKPLAVLFIVPVAVVCCPTATAAS